LTKRRIVVAVLAVVTVWPLVQLALVHRYDVSPWKLAGWGMYSTPRFDNVGMEVYGRRADGQQEQLTSPSREVAEQAAAFLESYKWLRALAPRDALADAVFRQHTQWDSLRLVVFRPELETATGMVVMTHAEYAHRRR
jgi:hypothetical protein